LLRHVYVQVAKVKARLTLAHPSCWKKSA
jgi:hypothetical protein